jgi:hypothetical protein
MHRGIEHEDSGLDSVVAADPKKKKNGCRYYSRTAVVAGIVAGRRWEEEGNFEKVPKN